MQEARDFILAARVGQVKTGMGAKVPAWQRLSAYDLGVAIDSWCQTMLNKGLAYFQCDAILDLPQASRCKEDPEDGWGLLSEDSPAPCLAMGADQGSSGWSLTWFMLNYLRLMCMPFLVHHVPTLLCPPLG
jgi:hypothetical protein